MPSIHYPSLRIDPISLEYRLPSHFIAQEPLEAREKARLLVLKRKNGRIEHRQFGDLDQILMRGDLLVLNKTKVSCRKLTGRKETGGKVDVILIEKLDDNKTWRSLLRPPLKIGQYFSITEGVHVRVVERNRYGEFLLDFGRTCVEELLNEEGKIPLPPYIKRGENDLRSQRDGDHYQTVYAEVPGSLAAPTAGLHFSRPLLSSLKNKGVEVVELILHVGWGTFKPIIRSLDLHEMMAEKYEVSSAGLDSIRKARKEMRRIIAVGTTSTRVLESIPGTSEIFPLQGETRLFIKPGFSFRWISGLITNFHVPRSTPIALTAAFAGLNRLEKAYSEALGREYRFFSYGDAMIVL